MIQGLTHSTYLNDIACFAHKLNSVIIATYLISFTSSLQIANAELTGKVIRIDAIVVWFIFSVD